MAKTLVVEDFREQNKKLASGEINQKDYDKTFSNDRLHGKMNTKAGKALGPIKPFAIGGSDLAAIEGTSPYTTKVGLQRQKLGLSKKSSEEKQFIFDYGHIFEDSVGHMNTKLLGERLGRKLVYTPCEYGYLNPEWPHFLAHPDGYIKDLKTGEIFLGEVKTTSQWTGNWKEYYSQDRIPPEYISQIQVYMYLLGLKEAYLLAFGSSRSEKAFAQIHVALDEEYAKDMLDRAEEFVEDTIKGIRYDATDVDNIDALAKELAEEFAEEDPHADYVKLKKADFGDTFKEISALLDEEDSLKKRVKEIEATFKSTVAAEDIRLKEITKELAKLSALLIEEVGGNKGATFSDSDGIEWRIDLERGYSLSSDVKKFAAENFPDAWDAITSYKPLAPKVKYNRQKPKEDEDGKV